MIDARLVKTISQEIGSGPALAWYLEKMQLAGTIDRCVPRHPNRTELSHGQAVVALVTMILNHSHALYHMQEWAQESLILSQVLPGIAASAYTDDRLGDSLDALFAADLDYVQSQVSLAICKAFALPVQSIHSDTTSLSFYGAYESPQAPFQAAAPPAVIPPGAPGPGTWARPSSPSLPAPQITYGYSKQHRPDLKQLVLSLSVTDEQIPLYGAVLDGNTADATTYVGQWLAVSRILGRSDFLFLGDSKLATRKNLREIIDQQGIFLAATPLTSKLKRWLRNQVARGKLKLRPFEPIAGQLTKEEVAGYTSIPRGRSRWVLALSTASGNSSSARRRWLSARIGKGKSRSRLACRAWKRSMGSSIGINGKPPSRFKKRSINCVVSTLWPTRSSRGRSRRPPTRSGVCAVPVDRGKPANTARSRRCVIVWNMPWIKRPWHACVVWTGYSFA